MLISNRVSRKSHILNAKCLPSVEARVHCTGAVAVMRLVYETFRLVLEPMIRTIRVIKGVLGSATHDLLEEMFDNLPLVGSNPGRVP